MKLVDEPIKASEIEDPIPAAFQGDSSTTSESSSDAEQEFVSSVLQDNLSRAKELKQQVPRKGIILKQQQVERARPKPSRPDDVVNKVAEQLSQCTVDGPEEEKRAALDNSDSSQSSPVSESTGHDSGGLQVVFLGVSKRGAEQFKRLLAKSKPPASHGRRGPTVSLAAKENVLEALKQTFAEWRTGETSKLLHGTSFPATCLPEQALQASREREDFDEDEDSKNTSATPLPSYEQLKEETSLVELKVKEFYEGKFTSADEALTTQPGTEEHRSNVQVSILKRKGADAKLFFLQITKLSSKLCEILGAVKPYFLNL